MSHAAVTTGAIPRCQKVGGVWFELEGRDVSASVSYTEQCILFSVHISYHGFTLAGCIASIQLSLQIVLTKC